MKQVASITQIRIVQKPLIDCLFRTPEKPAILPLKTPSIKEQIESLKHVKLSTMVLSCKKESHSTLFTQDSP